MNQIFSHHKTNQRQLQRQRQQQQQRQQRQQQRQSQKLYPEKSFQGQRQKQRQFSSSFLLNQSQSRQLDNRKVRQWRQLSELNNPIIPLNQIKLNLFYILKNPQLFHYLIEILALRAQDDQISKITQKINDLKRQYNNKLLNKQLLNEESMQSIEKFDEFKKNYEFCNQLKRDISQSSKERDSLGEKLKIAVQQLANIKDKSSLQQGLILELIDKKTHRISEEVVESVNKLREDNHDDSQRLLIQILEKTTQVNQRNIAQIQSQTEKGLKLAEQVKIQMQNIVHSYQEQKMVVEGQNKNSEKKQHLTIELARLLKEESQQENALKQLKIKTLYPLKQQLNSLQNLKKEKQRQIKDLNTRKQVLQNQNIVWNQNQQLQQNSTSQIIKQINHDQQGLVDMTMYMNHHSENNYMNRSSNVARSTILLRNRSFINNAEIRKKPISVVKKNIYEKPLDLVIKIWAAVLFLIVILSGLNIISFNA